MAKGKDEKESQSVSGSFLMGRKALEMLRELEPLLKRGSRELRESQEEEGESEGETEEENEEEDNGVSALSVEDDIVPAVCVVLLLLFPVGTTPYMSDVMLSW